MKKKSYYVRFKKEDLLINLDYYLMICEFVDVAKSWRPTIVKSEEIIYNGVTSNIVDLDLLLEHIGL